MLYYVCRNKQFCLFMNFSCVFNISDSDSGCYKEAMECSLTLLVGGYKILLIGVVCLITMLWCYIYFYISLNQGCLKRCIS